MWHLAITLYAKEFTGLFYSWCQFWLRFYPTRHDKDLTAFWPMYQKYGLLWANTVSNYHINLPEQNTLFFPCPDPHSPLPYICHHFPQHTWLRRQSLSDGCSQMRSWGAERDAGTENEEERRESEARETKSGQNSRFKT